MDALTTRSGLHASCLALLLAITVVAGKASATAVLTDIFVFGDSLSETGNYEAVGFGDIAYPEPYAPGRFSNGPVWVEELAGSLGLAVSPSVLGGNNYAWGGATTDGQPGPLAPFDLGVQVAAFLAANGGVADAGALYVIWGGANDALAGDISNTADNILDIISDLSDAGAVHFLAPNFGEIAPIFADLNLDLATALDTAENTLPIDLTRVDVNALLTEVITDALVFGGATFGITNVFDPCWDGVNVCGDPDSYLLWDAIPHPTARTHELIGALAYAELRAIPLPAGVWLLASALGVLATTRRRRV